MQHGWVRQYRSTSTVDFPDFLVIGEVTYLFKSKYIFYLIKKLNVVFTILCINPRNSICLGSVIKLLLFQNYVQCSLPGQFIFLSSNSLFLMLSCHFWVVKLSYITKNIEEPFTIFVLIHNVCSDHIFYSDQKSHIFCATNYLLFYDEFGQLFSLKYIYISSSFKKWRI